MPATRSSPPASLSSTAFDRLRTLIYEHTGIYFRENKRYLLESQARRRVHALGLDGFDAYLRALQGRDAHGELQLLTNAITINETSFFRHPRQQEVMVARLLPTLAEHAVRRGLRQVRIWSAACSTGEEPYTVAILVKERLEARFPQLQFRITGTDINTDVLRRAQAGTYGTHAVRNVPVAYLHKYFTRSKDAFTLRPEVRRMVTFRRLNLTDDHAMRQMRNYDVIVCANVLIYFDSDVRRGVMAGLHQSLRRDGHLLIGVSETLPTTPGLFHTRLVDDARIYQKRSAAT